MESDSDALMLPLSGLFSMVILEISPEPMERLPVQFVKISEPVPYVSLQKLESEKFRFFSVTVTPSDT